MQTSAPIPHDLPLDLPAPAWLLQGLLVAFFIAHILFVNLMLGHGQRISNLLTHQNFGEEVCVHKATNHFASDAIVDRMPFEECHGEPPYPTQIVA